MAKKKAAAKKAAPKKKVAAPKPRFVKTAKWQSSRGSERAAAAKKTTKAEAQIPLIKGLRIPALDRDCRHIADTRSAIARLQAEEKDLERVTHEDMKKYKQVTWQSAGVTLVRVPGEERLRVATSRQSGSTTPGEAPVAEEPDEEGEPVDPQLVQAAGELNDAIVDDEVH